MYLMSSTRPRRAWSPPAQSLALAVCGEAIVAVLILARGAPGTRMALGAGLLAVITLPLIVRARMPMAAKTLLSVAVITATLSVAVGADLIGLRSIATAVVRAPVPEAPPVPVTIAAPSGRAAAVSVRSAGDPAAQAAAHDLAAVMSATPSGYELPGVESVVTSDPTGFSMRFALTRGGMRRRCGDVRVFGADRTTAVAAFHDALTGAIATSRDGTLACG